MAKVEYRVMTNIGFARTTDEFQAWITDMHNDHGWELVSATPRQQPSPYRVWDCVFRRKVT